MRRLVPAGLWLAWVCSCALGAYEVTAKAPDWLGRHLPGRQACRRAEQMTRWDPPTGLLPLDKLLHEGEEAMRYYGLLGRRPASARRQAVAPVLEVAQQRQVGLVAPAGNRP